MRALIAWCAFVAGALFLTVDIVRLQITGIALLGAALVILALWMGGVFSRDFWIEDIPESHPATLNRAERALRQESDQ